MQNSVSFLARLEFKGVDVGDRWQELAEVAKANSDGHSLVFTDLHHLIALCRAEMFDAAEAHLSSMANIAINQKSHLAKVITDVGLPVGQSIIAHGKGDHETALDLMMTHRIFLPRLGASNAQRDLLTIFGLEMARQAGASALMAQLVQEREFVRGLARHSNV